MMYNLVCKIDIDFNYNFHLINKNFYEQLLFAASYTTQLILKLTKEKSDETQTCRNGVLNKLTIKHALKIFAEMS